MCCIDKVVLPATAWLCLTIHLFAQTPASVLRYVPDDGRGFALVRGLESTKQKIDGLAARVQAPLPPLDAMLAAYKKGLDTQNSLCIAWLPEREGDDGQEALSHFVLYVPVTDYVEFVAQLGIEAPGEDIRQGELNGQPFAVAKKGDYAIFAQFDDKGSLEQVLNAKGSIVEISKALHDWSDRNDVTIALSPVGTQLLFSKLRDGLRVVKAGAVATAGDSSKTVEASLDMYQALFDASEREFAQVAVGLRIESGKSIEIHKRLLLSADGSFANSSKKLKSPENAWRGIPAEPFVAMFAGAMPAGWSRGMMTQSFSILKAMQGQDTNEITKEKMNQLADVAAKSIQGVRSMAFVMGVGTPGAGVYSRSFGLFHVDDSSAYMKRYEDTISEMSELMEEADLQISYEVERVRVSNTSALRITTDMSKLQFAGAAATDVSRFHDTMFGPGGKMSFYFAPADEHAVVMAYISPDNLTRAIDEYRAGKSAVVDDIHVKMTASLLPSSAQWSGFISPSGVVQFFTQMSSALGAGSEIDLPTFPASPPVGFAAELTSSYLDGQLVIPLETITAVMSFVPAVQQRRQ